MKKINIAYITKEDSRDRTQWSGSSRNIFNCLLMTGHRIERIGPFNSLFEKFLKIIELLYRQLGIKFDPERNIYLSKFFSKAIEKKIQIKKIDLIIVHDTTIISFLKTKIPIIIWTDLTFDLYQKSYFNNYKMFHSSSLNSGNYLEKLSLNKADKIIYTTRYALINAKNKYRISKNKLMVLPFGSDIKPITKNEFFKLQKKRIKNKKKELRFISVGIDWYRKNMSKSVEVINEINKRGLSASLKIVGAKPPGNFKEPKFIQIIPFLNKNDKKKFNKLKKLYLESDYFILLSKAEAFGLVILEANAFGLPLIVNNIDGIKYIADKKYSLLINKNTNPKKIATQIINLNKNINKYKNFSYNSLLSSHDNSWVYASKKLNKIIKSVLLKKNSI